MHKTILTQALAAMTAVTLLLTGCGGGGDSPASNLTSSIGQSPATSHAPSTSAPVVNLALSPALLAAGQTTTITWSSTGAMTCQAWGAWSGTKPTSGSTSLTARTAGTYPYGLTCTGVGGTTDVNTPITVTAAPMAAVGNSVPVIVDAGPSGQEYNQPYVSVTVCTPGTNVCQTIDHILVDTGSFGLRVMASAMNIAATPLPVVTNDSGVAVGTCAQFGSGFTWGSVRLADVKVGGEAAPNIPVEVIGDAGSAYSQVPTTCSNTGANIGTVAAIGAKGILGVGLEKQDCGAYCANHSTNWYYGCQAGGVCNETALPLSSQVTNPVTAFGADNNGVILSFPSVAAGGATNLQGTLTFGIGTQSNNTLGVHKVYSADTNGHFTSIYNNTNYASSFIDSGSNGLFLPDPTIAKCNTTGRAFCPTNAPLALTATNTGVNGVAGMVNFYIDSFATMPNTARAGSTGFDSSNNAALHGIDWGLPFFFGRSVAVGIRGASTIYGVGPYWAY